MRLTKLVPLVGRQDAARSAAELGVGAEQRPPADVDVVGVIAMRKAGAAQVHQRDDLAGCIGP